jgi:hypothetical protein
MNAPKITFWHSGIDRVVTGEPTGNMRDTKAWREGGWQADGKLIEIRWVDGKGMTFTTHVHENNILSYDLVA